MRVQVLQHMPFEEFGSIAGWCAPRGIIPRYTRRFLADAAVPRVEDCDLIIADLLTECAAKLQGGPWVQPPNRVSPHLRLMRRATHWLPGYWTTWTRLSNEPGRLGGQT